MSWSTSELRVRLAPLNRFKPSSKIFYWPFQGGTSFVDLLCFCSVLCLLCFVRVCLYVLCGHLLGKGWPLGSRLWCLLWVCHFPIGILGQVWYLIVSIPDLCTITYFCNRTVSQPLNMAFVIENGSRASWIFYQGQYVKETNSRQRNAPTEMIRAFATLGTQTLITRARKHRWNRKSLSLNRHLHSLKQVAVCSGKWRHQNKSWGTGGLQKYG